MPSNCHLNVNPLSVRTLCAFALLAATCLSPALAAAPEAPNLPARTPLQWITTAAALEIPTIRLEHPYMRYHLLYQGDKGLELRDEIESRDGMVARLIALNGQPLTPAKDAAEHARLQRLLDNPSDFYDHHKHDQDGKNLAVELLHQFPQAMIFSFAPDQTPAANNSSPQIVIDFQPDPKFKPRTTKGEALRGLAGRIWIEKPTGHLVRMHASIISDTNIGWGILARIYKGGSLDLEQTDAGPRWMFSHLDEHITVRALLVKTLNVNLKLQSAEYHPIEPMNFQDAIHILLNTPLPTQCPCY